MSILNKIGCLTLTWKIENFSIFLRAEDDNLNSPPWSISTSEGNEWWSLEVEKWDSNVTFKLVGLNGCSMLDLCDMFIVSSSGMVPMKYESLEEFSIDAGAISGNYRESISTQDTLTICCKMWKKTTKTEYIGLHSVLRKVNFIWNIVMPGSPHMVEDAFVEEADLLFHRTVEKNNQDGTYSVLVEGVPSRYGWFSLVDCQLSIKDNLGRVISGDYQNRPCTRWKGEIEIFQNSDVGRLPQLDLQLIVALHKDFQSSQSLIDNLQEITIDDGIRNTDGIWPAFYATRSRLLRRMFELDIMPEALTGIVGDREDSDALNQSFQSVYGKKLEDLQWEEVWALYYIADKYDVQSLKNRCFDILKSGLVVSNACIALVLADEFEDKELMKCIVDFICDHKEVLSLPEWNYLIKIYPHLASEIVLEVDLEKEKN